MAAMDQPVVSAPPERTRAWTDTLHDWVATVDHKKLGILYIASGIVFFVIAGLEAAAMRYQLAFPENDAISPEVFNRLFTMHGTTMVFLVGMPIITGFGNYLIPLMIGARDMAFPRLNAWGFWMFLFGGLLLYFSYFGSTGLYGAGSAPDVGWFAYTPAGRQGLLARQRHGLLDPGHPGLRLRLALGRRST